MNRIQSAAPHIEGHRDVPEFDGGRFVTDCEHVPHSVFAPLHYEPNYAYPLIVWLHGRGDSETQLKRIMPVVSLRNYVAVAPQGTAKTDSPCGGYTWPETAGASAEQRVFDCIAEVRSRLNIHPERIFIGGFQIGGTLAFQLAASHPGEFAGVLSFCGPFPKVGTPLARLAEVRRLPLFVTSGRDGEYYGSGQVCDDLRLLHTAGIAIDLRQYPCGDVLDSLMLRDANHWIMNQIQSASV